MAAKPIARLRGRDTTSVVVSVALLAALLLLILWHDRTTPRARARGPWLELVWPEPGAMPSQLCGRLGPPNARLFLNGVARPHQHGAFALQLGQSERVCFEVRSADGRIAGLTWTGRRFTERR